MFPQLRSNPLIEAFNRILLNLFGKTSRLGKIASPKDVSPKMGKSKVVNIIETPANDAPAQYYSENGLRKVVPYYYTFSAFCKRRWIDRRIDEVLLSEFNFDNAEIMRLRIESGNIKVNGKTVGADYLLKDSDLMHHSLHRHELPVLDSEIGVVFEDENLIVVNKPPSLPVHPCGQFNHNTLVRILENEMGLKNLNVIHRLDRMTSGLLLLGKTYEATLKIASEINDRGVAKYYICEVENNFKGPTQTETDRAEPIIVEKPLGKLNSKMGLNAVMSESEGGKPSKTSFIKLAWREPTNENDTGSSLLLCRLYTGRTHQVRIHLQYLGFPIVDDPLYNSLDWGETKGAFGVYREPRSDLISALSASRNRTAYLQTATAVRPFPEQGSVSVASLDTDDCPPAKMPRKDENSASFENLSSTWSYAAKIPEEQREILKAAYDPTCPDCNRSFADPEMSNMVLKLHAYRYSGSDWSYTAPLPSWAMDTARNAGVQDLTALVEDLMPLL